MSTTPHPTFTVGTATLNAHGELRVQTDLPLSGGRILRIVTCERPQGGLQTCASAMPTDGSGFSDNDYHTNVSYAGTRSREQAAEVINGLHTALLGCHAMLIADAERFYDEQAKDARRAAAYRASIDP